MGQSDTGAGRERTGLTLEGVVDEPLKSGEGTDHEDTGTETSPESGETDLGVDGTDGRLGLSGLERGVELEKDELRN